MYQDVLVTLDGSPASEAVLPVVERLVSGTGATVFLLTVGETPPATIEGRVEPARPLSVLGTAAAAPTLEHPFPRYGETKSQAIERLEWELEAYTGEQRSSPPPEWHRRSLRCRHRRSCRVDHRVRQAAAC